MRQNMSKEVIITFYRNQYLIVLLNDGKAVEIYLKPGDTIELGDIYIGKVKNIVQNIQAAFIEISPGIIGYYSLKSNSRHLVTKSGTSAKLQAGDEVVVQIAREAIKSKAPVLTSKLQIPGDTMVLLGNSDFIGISKKITKDEQRNALKNLGTALTENRDTGIIFRTKSLQKTEDELGHEFERMLVDYNNIMSISDKRTCFSKIYSGGNQWLKYVHAEQEADLRILTDIPEVYTQMSIVDENPGHIYELYEDSSYPLMKLKSLETQIDRALSSNVWLRSGASIVIEPTEALTAIDVNTSKTEIKKKDEETFHQINIEAAREICRQLRLRNLSGMILIDFINMKSQECNQELLDELRTQSKEDPVQTTVIDMTALGLVEMTRKRTYRPLHEQMNRK